ncbi:hypothetical protein BHE74_00047277 [Ensete ventricosum]|nr:hypothetical protein BHE74_00047277 [Ensete ventricosum]
MWTLTYKKAITRLYYQRVQSRWVSDSNLVLQKAEISHLVHTQGKLAQNREGPYQVVSTVRDSTYTLATMEGKTLMRTWHILNLKKFYPRASINILASSSQSANGSSSTARSGSPRSMSAALSSSLQHYSTSLSAASKYFTYASKLVARLSVAATAFGPTPDYNS